MNGTSNAIVVPMRRRYATRRETPIGVRSSSRLKKIPEHFLLFIYDLEAYLPLTMMRQIVSCLLIALAFAAFAPASYASGWLRAKILQSLYRRVMTAI